MAIVWLGAIGLLTVTAAAPAGADVIFAVDPLPKRRHLAPDLWSGIVAIRDEALDVFAADDTGDNRP